MYQNQAVRDENEAKKQNQQSSRLKLISLI